MDLWIEFEMNERIADMMQELGISAGTAIIVLIILYFVIKWAVKRGMTEAYREIQERYHKKEIIKKKTHDNSETGKIISDVGSIDDGKTENYNNEAASINIF